MEIHTLFPSEKYSHVDKIQNCSAQTVMALKSSSKRLALDGYLIYFYTDNVFVPRMFFFFFP